MRKPISKTAYYSGDAGLAFALNEMANKRKEEGASVVNVTLGTFYNDEGNLVSFTQIDELINKNLNQCSRSYAPIDGGSLFKKNVVAWVYGQYKENLYKKYYADACATPGGTGALYLAFRNYCEDNPVILPNIGWANYKAICGQMNKSFVFYSMFKDGLFDLDSVISLAKDSIERYGICTLLINDPCQNPTGYTLTDDEWTKLIDTLNELNKIGPVNLVLDVAYMEMAEEPRRFFKHINNVKADFNTIICFSGSKLFGIYGYRLGAAICVNALKENVDDFEKAALLTSRAVWSNCNHLMINAFNDFSTNKDMISSLSSELDEHKKILKDRYQRARKTFDSLIGCEPYPYKEGFFVVYPKENAKEFNNTLIKKDIFALPLENKYIRISICSFIKN